ncbi:hypothetical protein HanHA300_Chr03g0114861 [Helianthus annuus]|nr:hypothetical protein HanHA300_Chr03g0114861 [Helianthus annuus]
MADVRGFWILCWQSGTVTSFLVPMYCPWYKSSANTPGQSWIKWWQNRHLMYRSLRRWLMYKDWTRESWKHHVWRMHHRGYSCKDLPAGIGVKKVWAAANRLVRDKCFSLMLVDLGLRFLLGELASSEVLQSRDLA